MRLMAAAAMLALSAGGASASGGLSCEGKHDVAALSFDGGVTRGMGGALFSFDGGVEVSDETIAQDLRNTVFEREQVAQYWLDGEILRLVLYKEREDGPHGYVEATILTDAVEPHAEYAGTYSIEFYDMTDAGDGEARTATFEGSITCSVE